ncbi:MAG TPA: hypothetical protein EYP57_09570 [Thermodesulfobacteriaceae bacterium]|nr:hypothetical protein [Thermodesulfobacteriaceae bacterium]
MRRFDVRLLFLFLIITAATAPLVHADLQTITFRIDLRTVYNDNITFSSSNKIRDMILEAVPEVMWRYSTERNTAYATARLKGKLYWDHDEVNTIYQYYQAGVKSRVTERLRLALDGSYRTDDTLNTEFQEQGIVLNLDDRKVFDLHPRMDWQFTERSSLGFDYLFERTEYSTDANTGYSNHRIYFTYDYLWSDRPTRVFVRPGFYINDPDDDATSEYSTQLHFGMEYPFSERLRLTASAGPSYSWRDMKVSEFIPVAPGKWVPVTLEKTRTYLKFVGSLSLRGLLERGYWNLALFQDIYPTGYGGASVLRTRLVTNMDYGLFERLRCKGAITCTYYNSGGGPDPVDQTTFTVSPGIYYRLTERSNLGLYYNFRYRWDTEYDRDTIGNQVWLRFDIFRPFQF